MTAERAAPVQQQAKPQIEQAPMEQTPLMSAGPDLRQIRQLQRLVGNQRTQQIMRQPSASSLRPRIQRAPGLPPLRGVLQREDEAATPVAQSAANAAYDHIPESDITLTDVQIRNAIFYNQGRYQGNSLAALRRYLQLPAGTAFDAPMIRAIARYQMHYGLGSDGLIGQATYDHIDLHQMLEQTVNDTPGTDADLIFSINASLETLHWDFVPLPTAGFMRFRITRNFSVDVMMPQHAHPSQYRYRQMIRGNFVLTRPDGTLEDMGGMFSKIPVAHRLPAEFTEDGNTDWTGTGVFYGRRTDPGQRTTSANIGQNQYFDGTDSPDQHNGYHYRGTDGPKAIVQNVPVGGSIDLTMDFIGQVVRISDGQVMQQKRWQAFDFSMSVPSTQTISG